MPLPLCGRFRRWRSIWKSDTRKDCSSGNYLPAGFITVSDISILVRIKTPNAFDSLDTGRIICRKPIVRFHQSSNVMGFLRKRSKFHPLRREPIKSSLFQKQISLSASRLSLEADNPIACQFFLQQRGNDMVDSPCCRFRCWRSVYGKPSVEIEVGLAHLHSPLCSAFPPWKPASRFCDFAIRYALP